MSYFLNRRGQSTLEYVVVFVAVVGVILISVNRALRLQTCSIYQDAYNKMNQSTVNLEDKFGVSPNFSNTGP